MHDAPHAAAPDARPAAPHAVRPAGTHADLRTRLADLDGSGYRGYRALAGRWDFPGFALVVDHVQGDPFAPPSRMRVFRDSEASGLPEALCLPGPRAEGLACRIARQFAEAAGAEGGGGGPGVPEASSGPGESRGSDLSITAPGQEVLPISAVLVAPDRSVEARFTVRLPGRGRRIDGRAAARLLLEALPRVVDAALDARAYPSGDLERHALVNEDAHALREQLRARRLVAFVADGAVLPRRSGVDERPLEGAGVVMFDSPASLRITLDRPNAGPVSGMGIPVGVTLVTGGGYHGKSTLLRALTRGVWNHRPGDGREWVVTDPDAVKVRAEDGRSVAGVDISPFIGKLPGVGEGESDTRSFSTANASGSTSQAAAIVEALESGARVLLVDEDTAATNFMIRDRRMQKLVPREREPITPFVDRVRELHREMGVSSVLVLGGSGDYLDEADTVLTLDAFHCHEVTGRAREVAETCPTGRAREVLSPCVLPKPRILDPASLDPSRGRRAVSVRARGADRVAFGSSELDLSAVEPMVSVAQLRGIAEAMGWIAVGLRSGRLGGALPEILDAVEAAMDRAAGEGRTPLDALGRGTDGDLTGFRRHDLAAALNRLRGLRVEGVE
ncbi:MAG: ATPase [Gemmatimonadales bacterium]|nr:MAG: ATPase [Gemmatimonadales bacterium]